MTWANLRKRLRQSYHIALFGFFVACLLILSVALGDPVISPWIERIDGIIYDGLVRIHPHERPQFPHVVIIDIDDKSVAAEGRWPWPRTKLALLIDKLKAAGVVTVGLDIVMSEPEANMANVLKDQIGQSKNIQKSQRLKLARLLDNVAQEVDNDRILAQALSDQSSVLGYLFHYQKDIKKGNLPSPLFDSQSLPSGLQDTQFQEFSGYNGIHSNLLNSVKNAGFVTNLPDVDGTIRHAMLLAQHNNRLYPSFALSIVMHYLMATHVTLQTISDGLFSKRAVIKLDNLQIYTDAQGRILIPYWGSAGTLDYHSATDVLNGRVDKKELQGTIAIVGSTMPLLSDLHQSPAGQMFPGVEIVGNQVQAILGKMLIGEYNWHSIQGIGILLVTGLFFALFFLFLGSGPMLLVSISTMIMIAGILIYLFVYRHIYLPSGWLFVLTGVQIMVNFSCSFVMERNQRQKISQLFGQYVPETYVKELIETQGHVDMAGETRNMTVLFSDIRNFTTLSENLDAVAVKKLLNTFFTPITKIIFDHQGTIDKYVGDMVVAFWGAPLNDAQHTRHGIETALDMLVKLPDINADLQNKGLPELHFGVGMTTGMMNVGDMGSEFRRSYTVIGDTVNLASRLQDLTKFYHVEILVSESVCLGQDDYIWRLIDKVVVKGRHASLKIYQPLGWIQNAAPSVLDELAAYHAALDRYYAKDWSGAHAAFLALNQHAPNIYLYQLYLERVALYQTVKLPDDWNGVYVHEHK